MENAVCPVDGCQIPVDIVLRSSDEVLIGAHKINLDYYTDGFPTADSTSDCKEPVDLTEDGDTLKLLMPFAHKAQYPDLFDLSERRLFALAHSAEKYVVHAGIGACSIFIRAKCHQYPFKALDYAVKYNYTKIADLTAPMTLSIELSQMKLVLGGIGLYAWLQYKTTYIEGINDILYRQGGSTRMWNRPLSAFVCSTWDAYFPDIQKSIPQPSYAYLSRNTGASLLSLFQSEKPRCPRSGCRCDTALKEWKEDMVALIDTVPAFSTYLSSSNVGS